MEADKYTGRLEPGKVVEEFGSEHTREMEMQKIAAEAPIVVNWIERAFNAGYMAHATGKSLDEAFKQFCDDNC